MRVLHLTPYMAQGGAERAIAEIVHQPSSEFEYHVAIMHPLTAQFPLFYDLPPHVPIHTLDAPPTKQGYPHLLWNYWRLLRRLQPDVVHAHQWAAMNIARFFRRFTAPKVITTAHGDMVKDGRLKRERQLATFADCTSAVSLHVVQQYQDLVKQHAEWLPNGVNTMRFLPGERTTARQQIGADDEKTLLLAVGRISPEKNLLGLVEAVAAMQKTVPLDFCLWCIGAVNDISYHNKIYATIQSSGLNRDMVRLLPPTTNIVPYYQACDVLVLPSLREAMPTVVLEAAACGRPTLASEPANASQIILDGQTGWTTPLEQLSDKLHQVIGMPRQIRDTIGEQARQHILARYTVQQMVERYTALYRELG